MLEVLVLAGVFSGIMMIWLRGDSAETQPQVAATPTQAAVEAVVGVPEVVVRRTARASRKPAPLPEVTISTKQSQAQASGVLDEETLKELGYDPALWYKNVE